MFVKDNTYILYIGHAGLFAVALAAPDRDGEQDERHDGDKAHDYVDPQLVGASRNGARFNGLFERAEVVVDETPRTGFGASRITEKRYIYIYSILTLHYQVLRPHLPTVVLPGQLREIGNLHHQSRPVQTRLARRRHRDRSAIARAVLPVAPFVLVRLNGHAHLRAVLRVGQIEAVLQRQLLPDGRMPFRDRILLLAQLVLEQLAFAATDAPQILGGARRRKLDLCVVGGLVGDAHHQMVGGIVQLKVVGANVLGARVDGHIEGAAAATQLVWISGFRGHVKGRFVAAHAGRDATLEKDSWRLGGRRGGRRRHRCGRRLARIVFLLLGGRRLFRIVLRIRFVRKVLMVGAGGRPTYGQNTVAQAGQCVAATIRVHILGLPDHTVRRLETLLQYLDGDVRRHEYGLIAQVLVAGAARVHLAHAQRNGTVVVVVGTIRGRGRRVVGGFAFVRLGLERVLIGSGTVRRMDWSCGGAGFVLGLERHDRLVRGSEGRRWDLFAKNELSIFNKFH